MSTGIKTELRIRKIVQIVVLVSKPADLEKGRTQLTSLSTIKLKIKLVIDEVAITPYWMPCDINIPFLWL